MCGKWCVSKLCVGKWCVSGAGGGGRRRRRRTRTGVHNQEQEPHTKMRGKRSNIHHMIPFKLVPEKRIVSTTGRKHNKKHGRYGTFIFTRAYLNSC